MKKLTALSILFLSLAFVAPIQVSAATSAGVKPGSFFYFFDTASEKINLFFTFNSEKKVQKALEYADERLAEARESANENNPKAVEKAMTGYKEEISLATEKSKGLKDEERAKELLNIVSENTAKHQELLAGVLEKVPEEARQAILNAIEVSKKGQAEAVKQITELKSEIEKLKKEVEELKAKNEAQTKETEEIKKQKSEPSTSENTKAVKPATLPQSQVPTKTEEVVVPVAKNFKEPVLSSINAQIESYNAITRWIDSDMMPLLSQRESMLNGFISNTNSLMANETAPDIDHIYSLFIDEYNLDKKQIVDFYRWDIFDFIKKHINNEKLPALNSEYARFSAKPTVSEAEYNVAIQSLTQYQNDWQSLYNDGVKKAMVQYMSQTNAKDEMYKRLWSQMSQLYAAVADLKKTQALESSLNQLYLQQPKPLNCTFSSHYNGFGTVGSLNCY